MINREKYIEDGKVKRNRIALDIRSGKLDLDDIEDLVNDPAIAESFIGKSYSGKIPSKKWDNEYADKLAYAAMAECFNKDYLIYLKEVTDYVAEKQRKRGKVIVCGLIVGCVVLIIIAAIILFSRKDSTDVTNAITTKSENGARILVINTNNLSDISAIKIVLHNSEVL